MDEERAIFLKLAAQVARRCVVSGQEGQGPVRIDRLILGNGSKDTKGGVLREPQLRHVWALEMEHGTLAPRWLYALEQPTVEEYCFTGDRTMRARNDFVIFLEDAPAPSGDLRRIVVEFKNGAPQEKITQDLVKLMCEGTGPGIVGCALMTVYERVTSKTLSNLETTLTHAIRDAFKPDATTEDSTRHAVEEDSGTGSSETKAERGKVQQSSSWFEFLVLVREGEGQHGLYRAVGSKRRDLNLSDLADRNVCGGISLSPFP